MSKEEMVELVSFAPGGGAFGCGILGATGATPREAEINRLAEIERRILAIEETLRTRPVRQQGCICPPEAEKTCQGPLCPRRPIKW